MTYINHHPMLSRALLSPTLRVVSFGGGIQSWQCSSRRIAIYSARSRTSRSSVTLATKATRCGNITRPIAIRPQPRSSLSRRAIFSNTSGRSKCEPDGKQRATLPYYLAGGGQMMRTCTATFKIDAVTAKIRELLGVEKGHRVPKDTLVEVWVGFSFDERKRAGGYPGELWQEVRYPLLELGWTRGRCEQFLVANGYPVPPRSRCIICPYRSDESWRTLTPDEFEHACRIDDSLRAGGTPPIGYASMPYLHRERKPLREVDFTPPSMGLPLADDESEDCFGGCGT
jgi:hypothetical protein